MVHGFHCSITQIGHGKHAYESSLFASPGFTLIQRKIMSLNTWADETIQTIEAVFGR
jgi:hypothetical protein